jgi:hypothetical protein
MTDWLKVETTTPNKPNIRRIAQVCNCSRGDAFLAWFELWSYFDANTADGFVPFLTAGEADEIARLPGISKALAEGGWLTFDQTGCIVARFTKHNGQSAKARAQKTSRQQKWRANRESE